MFNCSKLLYRLSSQRNVFRNKCTKVTSKLKETTAVTAKKYYGQPTYESHPHLMKQGEIIPLITPQELQNRRQKLADLIVAHADKRYPEIKKHIIVIPSATKKYMSEKIPYVFRQNSDFLYLSGCQEPDTCLIITTDKETSKPVSTLFMRERDDHSEIWDGPRTGPTDAVQLFGVDQALPLQELPSFMRYYIQSRYPSSLWYDLMNPMQENIQKIIKEYLTHNVNKIWDTPKLFIHKLRLIKSPAEIELMQKSCNIASEAIIKCMQVSKSGISEHELFAQVDYQCRMQGAEYLAYPPVIAGGDRATIIHYINNNQLVNDGEMVLMDAGCEYHGYSSDITRTWAVNGVLSKEQREIYEAILSVQLELIDALRDFPTLDSLFDRMCLLLGKRLQEIGLNPKTTNTETIMKNAYQFCPHHVSHYLGMDVHDTCMIPRNIPVQPGMIVTVEPGVYINGKFKVPAEYRGIGIRIEDDVLITENGPVVLTAKCPKSLNDIENISSYKANRI